VIAVRGDGAVAQVVNLISEPSWREMRNLYIHTYFIHIYQHHLYTLYIYVLYTRTYILCMYIYIYISATPYSFPSTARSTTTL